MARYIYGGGGDGDIIKPTGVPYIGATANVFNARTGGTQITDLQNASGAGITTVTTDAYGQALFYGPDNYTGVLWLDFGSGVRWSLAPKDTGLVATRSISSQRAADASGASLTTKAKLPYNANDPLEQALAAQLDPLVIPRFASSSARDAAFPSPADGDQCYRTDLSARQIYNGAVGAWKSIHAFNISTVGIPNVNNTTTETQLSAITVPGGYSAIGSVYRLIAYGNCIQAANTTPTLTFRTRVGGITGPSFATTAFTAASNASPTNRPWRVETNITVVFNGSGALGQWFGDMHATCGITSTGTLSTTAPAIRLDGTAVLQRDTTANQDLVLTAQWDTASSSNSVNMYGCTWERVT